MSQHAERVKHIVGFSGGIDSQACARWVRERYGDDNVLLCNSTAGDNEHPLTTEFVAVYAKKVFPVHTLNATYADMWVGEEMPASKGLDPNQTITFGDMAQVKGRFPSRMAQFCTEKLKINPQKRWIKEMFGPTGLYVNTAVKNWT